MTKNSGQRDFRTLLLCVIALPILVGVGALVSLQSSKPTFDPASFGLPEFVGDFRILIVQTSDNTVCMLPIEKSLTLQALVPGAKALLDHDPIPVESIQALKEQGWDILYTGPETTREESVKVIEDRNEHNRANGCFRSYANLFAKYEHLITWSPLIPAP